MAMCPYAPSGITRRVLPVGARRRLAPTSSLPTRSLSTDWGGAEGRRQKELTHLNRLVGDYPDVASAHSALAEFPLARAA
jgi:hypothetical protein